MDLNSQLVLYQLQQHLNIDMPLQTTIRSSRPSFKDKRYGNLTFFCQPFALKVGDSRNVQQLCMSVSIAKKWVTHNLKLYHCLLSTLFRRTFGQEQRCQTAIAFTPPDLVWQGTLPRSEICAGIYRTEEKTTTGLEVAAKSELRRRRLYFMAYLATGLLPRK
jgi:hypothetical protein